MKSDIEIATQARLRPVAEIGDRLQIPPEALYPIGRDKAKLDLAWAGSVSGSLPERPQGKLILVTATSPTPAGEGKTTASIGLGDALARLGKRTAICLREPSLGPCFGVKGGAAGGGFSQIVPMEDINLHFTGDFHAIGSAHNLLAAMLDNHIYWGNALDIDLRRVSWRRVLDMNDRALRDIVCGLGGPSNGFPRQSGFDITVASEVMAIFCLAKDLSDLTQRLGSIIVGWTRAHKPVYARDLKAPGAMAVLLKNALCPNLVQTLEHTPAFVHGGPFANIAHGCNSVLATQSGLGLADYVVTEAGFGADLGAEKFLNIKCRKTGLQPSAAVVVTTLRALKTHGGVPSKALGVPDAAALERGLANLERHIRNLRRFGLPVLVAVNQFTTDTPQEHRLVQDFCKALDTRAHLCTHWAEGGKGALDLAKDVVAVADQPQAEFQLLYPDKADLATKIETVARTIYGAAAIEMSQKTRDQLRLFEDLGYGSVPVCMAKTQYSFSTDPRKLGAPEGHIVPIREVRLASGAGFVVAICGEIMTMPGLPRTPAAEHIRLNPESGATEGLF